MAGQRRPARLWLRRRAPPKASSWIISDGSKYIHTGVLEHEREEAERVYREYLAGKEQGANPIIAGRIRPVRVRERGLIYFVTCDVPDFPVKIGFATDLPARMAKMQVHLPYPVKVLATMRGTLQDEHLIHVGFSNIRLRGEWFRREAELLEFATSVNEAGDEAVAGEGREP
jgi:hypothetical protein